jgi:hypothetical protein
MQQSGAGNFARSRLLGGQSRLKAVPRGDPRPRLAAPQSVQSYADLISVHILSRSRCVADGMVPIH